MNLVLIESLEEISLAERAIGLVAGAEPFANTSSMEFIFAIPTLHRGQRLVTVLDRIANIALLDSSDFLFNVVSPQQNSRYNITISCLQQISNRQSPFSDFAQIYLKLLAYINLYRFKRIFMWNFELHWALQIVFLVSGHHFFSRFVQLKSQWAVCSAAKL